MRGAAFRQFLLSLAGYIMWDRDATSNSRTLHSRGTLATTKKQRDMKQFICLSFIFLLIGCAKNKNIEGFPFEYNGLILLNAQINDTIKSKLIFDTGANGLYLDSSFVVKSKISTLNSKKAYINGAGEQGYIQIDVIKDCITCKIDTHKFISNMTPILNYKKLLGIEIDGVIGLDFVKDYLFTVDFYNKRIYLNKFLKTHKTQQSIHFSFVNNRITIPIETVLANGDKINGDFLLDLGSEWALSFTSSCAANNDFNNRIIKKKKYINLHGGVSGKSEGFEFKAKYIKIGNIEINSPVLDYSLDSTGANSEKSNGLGNLKYIGIVGNEVLSKFILTFDFKNRMLYFSIKD